MNEEKIESNEPTEGEIENGKSIERTKPLSDAENEGVKAPVIRRGRISSVLIFEVRQDELDLIERGSSATLYLNFSIALLSTAISFLITLLTSDFEQKIYTFIIFVIVTCIGFILGLILFIIWYRQEDDSKKVIDNIRKRLVE